MSQLWNSVRATLARQREQAAIPQRTAGEPVPLTFGQRRLWFAERLSASRWQHVLNRSYEIRGPLDPDRLKDALQGVVSRHEALRTSIGEPPAQPLQRIESELECRIEHVDLCSLPERTRREKRRELEAEFPGQIDLARPPLWRFKLVSLTPEHHLMLGSIHHIIFDRWSSGLFRQELFERYEQLAAPQPGRDWPPVLQYGDFAVWQRRHYGEALLTARLEAWRRLFEGCAPPVGLRGDLQRTSPDRAAGRVDLELSEELDETAVEVCRARGISLFVLHLAAFSLLVRRLTGQDDLVFCMPVSGRDHRETRSSIGFYSNIVLCRVELSGRSFTDELLEHVAARAPMLESFGDLPFHMTSTAPELRSAPSDRLLFSFLNTPPAPAAIGELRVEDYHLSRSLADYELAFSVSRRDRRLHTSVLYRKRLFSPAFIGNLLRAYSGVLQELLAAG